MFAPFNRWLRRWADDGLRRENERLAAVAADLRTDLDKSQRTIAVQAVELDLLAAVCARNSKRVESETAAAARQIADSEKGR